MKLRKLISMVTVAAIVMTTAVIAIPTASALTNTSTEFYDDFESYTAGANYSNSLLAIIANGWYIVDNNTVYNNGGAAIGSNTQPYKALGYQIAKIVTQDGSTVMQLETPKNGTTYYPNYGIGRSLPGVSATGAGTGVYKIQFDYKPVNVSGKSMANFSLNTADGSASSETTAQHNILSTYNVNFYTGYRNYMTLYNNNNPIKQGTIDAAGAGGFIWYTIKATVDCNNRYYSVEFYNRSTGALIARRSPVEFDGNETIGFLKLSALGLSNKAYSCYIDNVHIWANQAQETTIYSDNFNAYSGNTAASVAMTSAVTGSDFFPAPTNVFSPWRAFSNVGTYGNYSFVTESGDQKLKLGSQGGTERSAMTYAMMDANLVDATSERGRGMLKVSFKVKPEAVNAANGFNVAVGSAPGASSAPTALFTMTPRNGYPAVSHGGNGKYTYLNNDEWYNVDIIFDVINQAQKVSISGGTIVSGDATFTYGSSNAPVVPTSIGQVHFIAGDSSGSYVLLDDVDISYVRPAPTVDTSEIVMTDNSGNVVSDLTDVTVAVGSITIPLGTIANGTTASNFTFVDDSSNAVSFTGTLNSGGTYDFGDTFTISPSTLLQSGKTYTLTVLTTTASAYGNTLSTPAVYTFTTTAAMQDLMSIKAVKVGGANVTELSDITAGSTINVETRYANNTESAITGVVIVAFYGTNKVVKMLTGNTSAAANSYGTNTTAISVPVDLDMAGVIKASVFLWDGFENIIPYCNGEIFE